MIACVQVKDGGTDRVIMILGYIFMNSRFYFHHILKPFQNYEEYSNISFIMQITAQVRIV